MQPLEWTHGKQKITISTTIDRRPLKNILLDSLWPGTVVWDNNFSYMDKYTGGWRLIFKNGPSAEVDIVIAADGANSKIRPYITDIKPIYSGITIVEGNVYRAEKDTLHLHNLVNGGKIFAFRR